MHTPSGDNWAALAYIQLPRVEIGCICKGSPVVAGGCVHFGWTNFLGTLQSMLMFPHNPKLQLGIYAMTAQWSPEGVCAFRLGEIPGLMFIDADVCQ